MIKPTFAFALLAFFALVLITMASLSSAQSAQPAQPQSGGLNDFVSSSTSAFDTSGQAFTNFVTKGKAIAGTPFGWIWESGKCEASSGWYSNAFYIWIAPTVTATMIVLILSAVIYMFGQLLQVPNLGSIAKETIFETLITIMRLTFIVGAMVALGGWYSTSASSLTNDPGGVYTATDPVDGQHTMIDAAMAYARLMIFQTSQDYSMLLVYNMILHTIYSATLWFGVTWRAMYSFSLGPALKPLVDLVGFVLQFLGVSIGEWVLHLVTLCLIKKWSVSTLLPATLFLRALPQTRSAGDALTALVFALAIIYPLMFLVDYEIYNITKGALVDSKTVISSFVRNSGLGGVASVLLGVALLLGGVIFPFFVGAALSVGFELVRNAVYYIMIISLLLPFFNIFITLTAAKEMARFNNVEVNFMAFVKII